MKNPFINIQNSDGKDFYVNVNSIDFIKKGEESNWVFMINIEKIKTNTSYDDLVALVNKAI
jgi:hypothetical protein